MKPQLLSELIELGAGKVRSMDCVMAITLKEEISSDLLNSRIKLAQEIYPETARLLIEHHVSLEKFAALPLNSKQQLVLGVIGSTLALKMSHYLGDALSMLLWIEVILTGQGERTEISYKQFPPKKDSPYRNLFPVKGWMNHLKVTRHRSYLTETFKHSQLTSDFSLNDILGLALLRSLPEKKKALWLPVNVRKNFWQGFGNGLSRMRLYPPKKSSLKEELTFIREQKTQAFKSGEIALPPHDLKLTPLTKKLITLWLNRPWADWGTLSFSHLEDRQLRFKDIESIHGVTNLHENHHAGFFAFTQQDKTYVTLTFDKAVPKLEAKYLLDKFNHHFQEILNELNS